jgi:hypothetical protein
LPAPGRMLWQLFCAVLNCGDCPALAGTICRTETCPPLLLTCGSGKSGTPWSRMQAEYLYAAVAMLCGWSAAVELVWGEEDPQPAARTAAAAIAVAATAARRRRGGCDGGECGVVCIQSCDRVGKVVESGW